MSNWEAPESAAGDVRRERRDTRFTLTPPLALSIGANARPAITVRLINISRSGAAILADELLGDPGVVLVLDLPDRTASEPAPVPYELRWALAEKDVLPHRWLHGGLFAHLDTRARRLIDRFMDSAGNG